MKDNPDSHRSYFTGRPYEVTVMQLPRRTISRSGGSPTRASPKALGALWSPMSDPPVDELEHGQATTALRAEAGARTRTTCLEGRDSSS